MNLVLTPAFFAGSPGPLELILIFVVILVVFGPERLPEIAKMFGKTMDQLRHASQEFKNQVMQIQDDVETGVTSTIESHTLDIASEDDEDDPYDDNVDNYSDYPEEEDDSHYEGEEEDDAVESEVVVDDPDLGSKEKSFTDVQSSDQIEKDRQASLIGNGEDGNDIT